MKDENSKQDNIGILNKTDTEMFDRNIKRLDDMTGEMFKEKIPTDPREVRLAREVIESTNNALSQKAALNLKAMQIAAVDKTNQTVIDVITRNAEKRKLDGKILTEESVIVDDDILPELIVVPGQLEEGHVPLDMDKVIELGTVAIEDEDE